MACAIRRVVLEKASTVGRLILRTGFRLPSFLLPANPAVTGVQGQSRNRSGIEASQGRVNGWKIPPVCMIVGDNR